MNMDRHTLMASVVELLCAIAPELNYARSLRQQVDLDSMDWLNFLVSLHERFAVSIAESDYARLVSLNDIVDYLEARLA